MPGLVKTVLLYFSKLSLYSVSGLFIILIRKDTGAIPDECMVDGRKNF